MVCFSILSLAAAWSIPYRIGLTLQPPQVSDLVWLGEKPYDDITGAGSLGVEFAGTAISSTGNRKRINGTDADAQARVNQNEVLQWQDGYYRGYFLLTVGKDRVESQFFGEQ